MFANDLYVVNWCLKAAHVPYSTTSPVIVRAGRFGFSGLLAHPWTRLTWSLSISIAKVASGSSSVSAPHPGAGHFNLTPVIFAVVRLDITS